MSDLQKYTMNFDEVSKIMKKTHFWKFVAFGTVCIRQEYEVYEQLAKDRFFDMSKFLKKTVERFWKAASTGYSMDEQYIFAVEQSFLEEFATRNHESLLGEEYLTNRPKQKSEKPSKKQLPEIRATSIDFDREKKDNDNSWLLHSTPKQWVLGRECDMYQNGAYAKYYREKNLLDLCYVMDVVYQLNAEADYIEHRDARRVRGFWYLSALTWLRAYQLREKGYPVKWVPYFERHENGDEGFQPVFDMMLGAYASGEDWMLSQIQHFSSEKEKTWTAPLLQLLTGESSQEIYSLVETWEDCERKKIILAILQEDKKEIRKILLHMIRHDRQMYDMYRTMVDIAAYAFIRLAKERGIEMEPIRAAEVLDGNLDMTPVDKSFFKLPYQEEIDEWLATH